MHLARQRPPDHLLGHVPCRDAACRDRSRSRRPSRGACTRDLRSPGCPRRRAHTGSRPRRRPKRRSRARPSSSPTSAFASAVPRVSCMCSANFSDRHLVEEALHDLAASAAACPRRSCRRARPGSSPARAAAARSRRRLRGSTSPSYGQPQTVDTIARAPRARLARRAARSREHARACRRSSCSRSSCCASRSRSRTRRSRGAPRRARAPGPRALGQSALNVTPSGGGVLRASSSASASWGSTSAKRSS